MFKNVIRIDVEMSFPMGAHFYKNINEMVYKQLLSFIHRLSCISVDKKCVDCPLKDKCNYYKFTGENFSGYPGLLIKNDLFTKSIYQKREAITFTFYCIGETRYLKEYIRIFFEQHLQQQLCGHFFYLKGIKESFVEDLYEDNTSISTISRNEEDSLSIYIDMMKYFNEKYSTTFEIPDNQNHLIHNSMKKIDAPKISLETRNIYRNGFLITSRYEMPFKLLTLFKEIRIGKTGFIGGV